MDADIIALPETAASVGESVAVAMRDMGRPMWVHHVQYNTEIQNGPQAWETTILISPDLGDYSVIESSRDGSSNTNVVPSAVAMPVDGDGSHRRRGARRRPAAGLHGQLARRSAVARRPVRRQQRDHGRRLQRHGRPHGRAGRRRRNARPMPTMRPSRPATGLSAPGRAPCPPSPVRRSTTCSTRATGSRRGRSCCARWTAPAATTARSSSSSSRPAEGRAGEAPVAPACDTGCMSTEGETDTIDAIPAEPASAEAAKPASSTTNRRQPFPKGFLDTISTGWAERPDTMPPAREQASFAGCPAGRRLRRVPRQAPDRPAGSLATRSNDTDYPFRAHSAFAHLTGWASDAEPDSVLVFEPIRPRSRRDPLLPRARRPHDERVLLRRDDRRVLDRTAAVARGGRRGPRRGDRAHRRLRRHPTTTCWSERTRSSRASSARCAS